MNIRIFFISIISMLSTATVAFAEDYIPKSPTDGLTPEARTFQRYGDIPVSLYTGTPNVTIPLSALRNGDTTIPVEISYHCGGVKPDIRPGSTGLGWQLTLSGAITRSKNNFPDELDDAGFLYTYGMTKTLDKHPATIIDELAKVTDDKGYLQPSYWFIRDTQPDIFSFSFLGYRGFFMLNNSGEWVVSCDRPLKFVSHSLIRPVDIDSKIFKSTNSLVLGSFVLQGEDGTLYTFGGKTGNVYAIDLSVNFMMQNSNTWESNAWYLSEIRRPNGEVVAFKYIHPGFSVNFNRNEYWSAIYDSGGNVIGANLPSEHQGVLTYPAYLQSVDGDNFSAILSYSKCHALDYDQLDYQLRLAVDVDNTGDEARPIYFSNYNRLEDVIDAVRPYKLDKIEIYYKDNYSFKQSIAFGYEENSNIRLLLKSVSFSGIDGKKGEEFKFRYHRPERMPRYLARKNDHWGYYNDIDYDGDDPFTSNAPSPKVQIFGSLREIIYPTGGKTVFEFEPNTYSRVANTMSTGDLDEVDQQLAGGIRIKRITNVPNDNTTPEVREFFYVRGFTGDTTGCTSSGILECPPVYEHNIQFSNRWFLLEGSDTPLSNIINPSGFHIGYQEVVEKDAKGGYKISRFSSAADIGFKDEAPISYSINHNFLPISSKSSIRGRLLAESIYDHTGKLKVKREIQYEILGGSESYIHSLYLNRAQTSALGSHVLSYDYVTYSLFKNFIYQIKERCITESQFGSDPAVPLVCRQYLRYNHHGQLIADSTVTTRQGKPHVSLTRIVYEWEKNNTFATRHFISYPSEVIKFDNGKKIAHTAIGYGLTMTRNSSPFVMSVKQKSTTNAQSRQLYECLDCDKFCRPLLIRNADGQLIAYIWRDSHFIPTIEVRLSAPEDYTYLKNMVGSLPYEEDNIPDFVASLQQGLPTALITCYEYGLSVGATSVTDPSARRMKYEYDALGRLVKIYDHDGNTTSAYRYSLWSGY